LRPAAARITPAATTPGYDTRACFGRRHVGKLNRMVQDNDQLDATFAALADPTRRGILDRLGKADCSISDLAAAFGMTLTGVKKHVRVLEDAGLVSTEKVGRVRVCRLGPRRLDDETKWIAGYMRSLQGRLDRLGEFLQREKG
jgi:DNA-binding transcriptional ArsR family regulator